MKLHTVKSGGQTGVDQTSLRKAKELGLNTGGWAPKGWTTDEGPAPWLGTEYGLKEHHKSGYVARTHDNTRDSDITVWFGKKSPGYWCTHMGCNKYGKLFIDNPTPEEFREFASKYEVINVAGNRKRINPQASDDCEAAFEGLRPEGCKVCVGNTCMHLESIRRSNSSDF